jgi:hypothetical protein
MLNVARPPQVVGRRLMLWLLTAVLAGCAAFAPVPPEEAVKRRAQERWAALIAGEWDKAYDYMAPSFRALVERKRFANQFGGGAAWEGAEVVGVACPEPDRCIATIKMAFRPVLGVRRGEPMSTHFEETWLREEGQWWLYQKI